MPRGSKGRAKEGAIAGIKAMARTAEGGQPRPRIARVCLTVLPPALLDKVQVEVQVEAAVEIRLRRRNQASDPRMRLDGRVGRPPLVDHPWLLLLRAQCQTARKARTIER